MSVQEDLVKIKEIKKSLNTAIKAKGSDIADNTRFDQYPDKINGIATGAKELAKYTVDSDGRLSYGGFDITGAFDNVKTVLPYALYHAFDPYSNYTDNYITGEINFPELTTVYEYAFQYAFQYCRYVTAANFPKLTKISNFAFADAFGLNQNLSRINFNSLEEVGDHGMSQCFAFSGKSSASQLNVNFPKLTLIAGYGMYGCFQGSSLSSIKFPELRSIEANGLERAFIACTNLTEITFPKLSSVGDNFLDGAFQGCTNLTSIVFPTSMEDTITATSSYIKKFGAPNATISFFDFG